MERDKFLEMIKELNDLKIIQKSYDFEEDLPEDICAKYFENVEYKKLKSGINTNERRWCEISISVYDYKCYLLGVRHVSKMYSETSSWEDFYHTITFHEMEEIQVTSYKVKQWE